MHLTLDRLIIREFSVDDAASIASLANNRAIWLNLRDRFPHPYTLSDAQAFIATCRSEQPAHSFATPHRLNPEKHRPRRKRYGHDDRPQDDRPLCTCARAGHPLR